MTCDGHFPGGAGEVVERDRLGQHFGGCHVELKSEKSTNFRSESGKTGFDCVISQQRMNYIRGAHCSVQCVH